MNETCTQRHNTRHKDASSMKKSSNSHRARRLALAMIDSGISLVAVDFDRTIVDVHTGGRWKQPSSVLASHVRPFFKKFLCEAQHVGLWVAVVTFSAQTQLVADTMSISLGGESQIKRCFLRGQDSGWTPQKTGAGNWHLNLSKGKLGHIYSVVKHIQKLTGECIAPSEVFYIDDDLKNVDIARKSGLIHSCWCPSTYEPNSANKLIWKELEDKYLRKQSLHILGTTADVDGNIGSGSKSLTKTCVMC